MADHDSNDVHQIVQERYTRIAKQESSCCNPEKAGEKRPAPLGYSSGEISGLTEVAATSLGCGNPLGLEAIRQGDVVLDLGSGTGLDCFLAARETGPDGRVIGVDMTPEMVAKARQNAEQHGMRNVEFRLGQIESLPVEDRTVDLVISNCVINLSPEKGQVFREVFRVLQPGGRMVFTDIVATGPIDSELKADPDALAGCVSGAVEIGEVERMLEMAGFTDIDISTVDQDWVKTSECCGGERRAPVISAMIRAAKPAGRE